MTEIIIERISEVNGEVLEAAQRLAPLLDSSNQVNLSVEYLEQVVNSPDSYWLTARKAKDTRIIGLANLIILPVLTNVRSSLECVVVDEGARGVGVGTALCAEAKKIADERGVNTLRAAASRTNTASQTMLRKFGFIVETSMDYFEYSIQKGSRF